MKGLSRRGLPINPYLSQNSVLACAQFAIGDSKYVKSALDPGRERARSAANTFRVVDAILGACERADPPGWPPRKAPIRG